MFSCRSSMLYMYSKHSARINSLCASSFLPLSSRSLTRFLRSTVAVSRTTSSLTPLLTSTCHFTTPGKVKVNLTTQDGTNFNMECEPNQQLMNAIRDEHKLEMAGYCEGKMECCTCLVHLSEKWYNQLAPPSEEEQDTIDKSKDKAPFPRLACQIKLTPEVDGIEVTMPKEVTCLLWDDQCSS